MVRRSGPNRRPGQRSPVFKEITWLRRWPRLVSTCFILLILLEILVFVWVADRIGLGLTLIAVVGSAFIGLWLIRRTGLDMVGKLRLTLAQGEEPGHSLVDGACFVIAGLLLILPGFISDLAAVLLMLPMTRNWLIRRFAGKIVTGFGVKAGTTVISDVEFHEVRTTDPSATGEPDIELIEASATEHQEQEARPPRVEPEIWVPERREEAHDPAVANTDTDPAAEIEPDAVTAPGAEPASPARPEDEPWGRAPRRPIIDVEES
jgi:UPF0716 protein FxsA